MTQRCNHCQAENLVGEGLGPHSPAPMCMRCGQPMQLSAQPAAQASAPAEALVSLVPKAEAENAANDFEGSTVMVQRPNLAAAAAKAGAPNAGAGQSPSPAGQPAVDEEAWHALVEGTQQGPLTLVALRHFYREKKLTEASLLWRGGMAAWTPLENLPLVLGALRAAAGNEAAVDAAKAQSTKALLSLVEEEVHSLAAQAPAPAAPAPASVRASSVAAPLGASPAGPRGAAPAGRSKLIAGATLAAVLAAAAGFLLLRPAPAKDAQVAENAPAATPAPAAPGTDAQAASAATATSNVTPNAPPPPAAAPVAAPAPAPAPVVPPAAAVRAAPTATEEPAASPSRAGKRGGHGKGARGHRR